MIVIRGGEDSFVMNVCFLYELFINFPVSYTSDVIILFLFNFAFFFFLFFPLNIDFYKPFNKSATIGFSMRVYCCFTFSTVNIVVKIMIGYDLILTKHAHSTELTLNERLIYHLSYANISKFGQTLNYLCWE